VPGDDETKVAKAAGRRADAVIFDLEDAVALSRKHAAREIVGARLARPADPEATTRMWVRVNAHDELWRDDLEAVLSPSLTT